MRPRRVIDLGCGPGFWLALLNELLPADCELIGVDSDPSALDLAKRRASAWTRSVAFAQVDFDNNAEALPEGDLTLAFNIFPYVADPAGLLDLVADRGGALAVRQYDGAALRFGPLDQRRRALIENSLYAAVTSSTQFRHYDMDRTFALLAESRFTSKKIGFELFERVAPFSSEFQDYYDGTLKWTLELLSDDAAAALLEWLDASEGQRLRYFYEVDLTAVLS